MKFKFWNLKAFFKAKEVIEVIEVIEKAEKIDGWHLEIHMSGRRHDLYHLYMKDLWKIYKWFLTKDSSKYNVTYDKGMYVVERKNIEYMNLTKIKLLKKDWV